MPYNIVKDNQKIITITYQGTVNLVQRMEAVDDACRLIGDTEKAILLIDVRDIEMDMNMDEQERFGKYLPSQSKLKTAKVAVLHPKQRNPNEIINSYAYMDGYCVVSFSDYFEARQWLLGALNLN